MIHVEIHYFIDNFKYFAAIHAQCFNSPTPHLQSIITIIILAQTPQSPEHDDVILERSLWIWQENMLHRHGSMCLPFCSVILVLVGWIYADFHIWNWPEAVLHNVLIWRTRSFFMVNCKYLRKIFSKKTSPGYILAKSDHRNCYCQTQNLT